jgi:hypothetical protein
MEYIDSCVFDSHTCCMRDIIENSINLETFSIQRLEYKYDDDIMSMCPCSLYLLYSIINFIMDANR